MSRRRAACDMLLVDTVSVPEDRVEDYLALLHDDVRPRMTAAGARFVHVLRSAAGLGEPVDLQIAWSFADLVQWNEIRRSLVLDPGYYAAAERLAALRLAGTRRFMEQLDGAPPTRPAS